ncbi:tandem-95 repeat protein [Stieleria sp. TO1_6]|uniref:tandem-95 repeat protein n=1 Tax=Stieleria tagensis TaxID=2956795 RepID=UPI00209A7C32|nr:tandem-95 repeat protein [Stieleria tagensis]MCO8121426.1 tandem-95 repeat protein [Stieleria tagensis]
MTSRERKNSTSNKVSQDVTESNISESNAAPTASSGRGKRRERKARDLRRRQLFQTLEQRHLLAGPQLIGIQPNEGALITEGSVRDSSPRVLTFGFDDAQVLDAQTFDGIQISRAGEDGQLGTSDDVAVTPGLVTLGDPNQNEVVVRFAEALPDDQYRIEVFGFDDTGLGITGLRNTNNELFIPSDPNERSEIIDFKLSLGALVESVVPQPVIRNADGSLTQNRNEVVVYFNEDPLFVENDDAGNPTTRSAENPRFYQLLLTNETVRTTDDLLFNPDQVVYDDATNTARLIFSDDINDLPGVPMEGGTWRLRVGTAVDDRVDLILPPQQLAAQPTAVTDFQYDGLRVTFALRQVGEAASGKTVRFENTAAGGLSVRLDADDNIVFDFGGTSPTVDDLKNIVVSTPAVSAVMTMRSERNGDSSQGGTLVVPTSVIGAPPLSLQAAGDTLTTSLDVGVFGQNDSITSVVVSESIDPQPFDIELGGGNDDAGHRDLAGSAGELRRHINPAFGADATDGITEISYNFQGIFDSVGTTDYLNQISATQKTRIREVLNLWSANIGVQFTETMNEGITFAVGDTANLQPVAGTTLVGPGQFVGQSVSQALQASLRIDPTFTDSAIVFSNQASFDLAYGEDFTRKAAAGVGFLLGLEQAPDLAPQTVMALDPTFLNQSIDTAISQVDLEPVFPGNEDVLHGQYVHRPDSIDIDMYRFEVNLGDDDKIGTLTVETFAERLADSSLLDTALSLFQEVRASSISDLGFGSALGVTFQAVTPGLAGNGTTVRFIQSDRAAGDAQVKVIRVFDDAGNPIPNAVLLDLPRAGRNVPGLTAQQVVDAVNNDPFASSILRAAVTLGDPQADISGQTAAPLPVVLEDGGLVELSKNDDYFSEDSRIVASLGEGVYYVGVSASGNESYDPTIPGSGFGGLTQGAYDVHFKFEPQVDEVDVIRDLDSDRVGVPGTRLDGDGDGAPGGVNNFWFQTRPENRILNFTDDGEAVVPGQKITVVSGSGVVRTYEFVPTGQSPVPGNVPVFFSDGSNGFPTPAGNLAAALAAEINLRQGETGVSVTRVGTGLEFVGERSIDLSLNFRAADAIGRNIFVDKTAGPNADGSLAHPFNNIANPNVANAFGSAIDGDIVRIVGNGGVDGDLSTELDNFSYKIGISDVGGNALEDGRTMNVPRGVTTMVDAGAVLKLRGSYINVGSSTLQIDRSNSALQILGTPRLVELSASGDPIVTTLIGDEDAGINGYDDGSVIITSIRDRAADAAAAGNSPAAQAGDWGGIIYRRDLDQFEGRRDLEDEGIFLQRINHAELRYGGSSNVLIDSVQQLVNPILIINLRPTITFNEITRSADSAISASPDSFAETSFQAPRYQQAGEFTADYDRVGPEISNNTLAQNTVNGLFIRVPTTATQVPRELTVSGRFDDIDIVHVLPENLVVASKPGGSVQDGFAPSLSLVSARELPGGSLEAGSYVYKMTFVDGDGFESLASLDQFAFTVGSDNSSVELTALPLVSSGTDYVSRRLYRAEASATPEFRLVADLDASSASFVDNLALDPTAAGQVALDLTRQGIRGRLDASLVLDPGIVMKLSGSRIELQPGSVMLAEGDGSNPIVMTSIRDDRFGAGGTFDTNNDDGSPIAQVAAHGDWAGIYAGPTSSISIDNSVVAYAGGISLIEGGETRGFVPLQLQQADGRITNSRFEFNDSGQDGAGPAGRFGRLSAAPSTIFVRGSQPIIVGNTFVDNDGSLIDIDSDSLTADRVIDIGRQTGSVDRFSELDDNFGPMVRFNRYDDNDLPGLDQITGMEIRGGTLATESVWDDTDIVHLVFDTIIVDNVHSGGGLKLRSRPDESLVVKLGDQDSFQVNGLSSGQGTPNSDTIGTGLTASGTPNDAIDRIGGSISILGLPDAPVVLTSFRDDSVGAGLTPRGTQFTDSNGDKTNSRPEPNDWRSILLDQYSSDRNVDVIPEQELSTEVAPGLNDSVDNAQVLGQLASKLTASDEVLRLGFEVEGFLSNNDDVDTYSFIGSPGTEIWVDVDKTSFTLDTVIELLDANGNVLARSDNSGDEIADGSTVEVFDPRLDGTTTSLLARDPQYSEFGVGGVYEDHDTTNPRDAGIHFTLTGNAADPNSRSTYFFRVRSASINPDDSGGGLTRGGYRFQVRLTEDQEFAGSVIRYSDIRYANHGIHVQGLLGTSPLLGEAAENEAAAGEAADNDQIIRDIEFGFGTASTEAPQQRAQYLGNLVGNRGNVISVAGELGTSSDVDFYQMDVLNDDVTNGIRSTIFDIDYADGFNRPNTNISVYYDPDGEFNDNELPRLILFGTDSNILDDLTSPNGENDGSEKLSRGSIATGDPLIGPVTLPEGTYYVGVTAAGMEPAALTSSSLVRVEPVNSVRRIAEQRFDIGEPPSTANGPSLAQLFTTAAINASGFDLLGDFLNGHGKPAHFDGSNGPVVNFNQVLPETVATGGGDAPGTAAGAFRAPNLDGLNWNLVDSAEIGGAYGFNIQTGGFDSENTSTTLPHVSIQGSLGSDRSDLFEFTVDTDGSRVILDIDDGHNITQILDPDSEIINFVPDPTSIDTTLHLFQEVPGTGTYVRVGNTELSSLTLDGRAGSNSTFDPFTDLVLDAGVYVVAVAQSQVGVTINNGAITTANTDPLGGPLNYRLHVSVENHAIPPATSGNTTLNYDRINNTTPATITSEAFDLTGYVAEDLPRFYFNYRYDPFFDFANGTSDDVSVRVFSNEDPAGREIASNIDFNADNRWHQLKEDLGDFAGHTGIQLEFTYTPTPGASATDEGLFLDDFIIGFAERGETVFNAPAGEDGFVGFGSGGSGEYQLEARPATEYASTTTFGLDLVSDFDTNDRHTQAITIVAPEGSQLTDGDTFVIGDGGSNQTFEFTTTPGSVAFGNTPVLFSLTDTPAQVAEAIRAAITLQTSIAIEASSAAGQDNEPMTDGRLSLSGSARGSFDSIASVAQAPAPGTALNMDVNGNLLLPAILHDGYGDSNYLRTQGQLILDSNKISDVRAIGIWSEPGIRDVDPEDIRNEFNGGIFGSFIPLIDGNHPFLQMPPVGNTYPGAARNLPTLNDSVLGGLAPGVVIANNTIDNAGFAGIKVDGETAPFVLDARDLIDPTVVDPELGNLAGGTIRDGGLMKIDSGGTSVIFEFEEIDGVPAPIGSGTQGGNGVEDGHVPIYYREDVASGYNRTNAVDRISYSSIELATSIMQSIQGSILVTNGIVELVTPTIGPSPYRRNRALESVAQTAMSYDSAAVYLQGVTAITFYAPGQNGFSASQAPVAESAQPFARIVNNTIYGSDGREALFPESNDEPNDVIATAIDTKIGPSHNSVYTSVANLGDNNGPVGPAGDVDFYQVNLNVGDRLVVDIDSEAGEANTSVQIFNERGERQTFDDGTGTLTTLSSGGVAPDYLNPTSAKDLASTFLTLQNGTPTDGNLIVITEDPNAVDPATPLVVTYEFDSANGVAAGNVAVPFQAGDSPATIAANLATAISTNNGGLVLTAAATASGLVELKHLSDTDVSLTGNSGVAFVPGAPASNDGFVDFFAPKKGVYYVAVSGDINVGFDANAISGRPDGVADIGQYTINMETYAPRTAVISADTGRATGMIGSDVMGTSFTITQVTDLPPGSIVNGLANQVTFRFGPALNAGEVSIPIADNDFKPDIMRAISRAIEPRANNRPMTLLANSPLPNNDSPQVPGPIARVRATALGGYEGDNDGLMNMTRRGLDNGVWMTHRDGFGNSSNQDFFTNIVQYQDTIGFGHDRRTTPGNGTTENYVYLENIAKIELSPEAIAGGLRLDPQPGFDTDQLINETGVMITSGASPALLNNVLINLHESVVVAESRIGGFGSGGTDLQVKPMEVVVVGSVFQYDQPNPTLFSQVPNPPVGLTTNGNVGPSNVNGGTDDFNLTNADNATTLVNAGGDNFLPAPFSSVIDSNIDSLRERSALASLKQSVGIPISNVLAPTRDVTGVNRADNPLYPNTGQGSSVFGDRGSTELADLVGPIAIAEAPRDNDAEGIDKDPNTSFIALTGGVYDEFRIQLRDSGDASDPFTGSGIDDNTVVVSEIPGVRPSGANVTLFEDDRLLVENLDYTFNYDETKNIITLTPLAGIWNNDRAYRIEMNNRDRTVIIAPNGTQVSDGDQIQITDSNGGQVVFEFESGYLLQMPEALMLQVPREGTNQGGLIDGGIFTINDGVNPVVVFEFDADGTTLPNSVPVTLPSGPTPIGSDDLTLFLAEIAVNIETAIQSVIDDPNTTLDVDVEAVGSSVVIGSEANTRVDVSTSGLIAAARTLGLQVPSAGADVGGVLPGDTFQVSDGNVTLGFQFTDANTPAAAGLVAVDISPIGGGVPVPLDAQMVAEAIQTAIVDSSLNLVPSIVGRTVYLNLPVDGSASVPSGQLRAVGISRTPEDGDLITFSPADGSADVVFEINRTDERDANGMIIDPNNGDGVAQDHAPINITRETTGNEMADLLAAAIEARDIDGVNPNDVDSINGGVVQVGGEIGLGLTVSGSSLQVLGAPSVTGSSTLEVFGPLLLQVPFTAPDDGDTFTILDPAGTAVLFEFDLNNVLNNLTATRVPFTRFDDVDMLSAAITTAINGSTAGVTATYQSNGRISLGQIDDSRVDTTGSTLTTQRGIVSDGEVLTIRQGNLSISYEFESVNNGGGVNAQNVPVPFQPGSTTTDVANSLAAAINSNNGGLQLSASVVNGEVLLDDQPGTLVDVSAAPSLLLSGVPGGAVPVVISPGDSPFDVKQALLTAINSVNINAGGVVTSLAAQDRGGATLFVENGVLFEGPITSFYLPAIQDVQGNPLEANRSDNSTQFTILMPTVGLDYGDAPDPVTNIPGRYPTLLANDGPRHVVVDDLYLGSQIDVDANGQSSRDADGDDAVNDVTTTGTLFSVTFSGGEAIVNVNSATVDPLTRDGDTIVINTGVTTATLEFDLNGRFDEDSFAIQPTDPTDVNSILQAISDAIDESPVQPAGVEFVSTSIVINGDDEDGVTFTSNQNPGGVFNKHVVTPIEFTVTGSGILQGWIDYNADGEWSANEAIKFYEPGADRATAIPRTSLALSGDGTQTYTYDTYVPTSSPDPLAPTPTTARFRFSRTGNLEPTGLALSGEVEDYQVLLLNGTPPTLTPPQLNRSFSVNEEQVLQALDVDGSLTPTITTDNGLLAGVVDADGDPVEIFPADAVVRDLFTPNGTLAGELDLNTNGTFTFRPATDFNGTVDFTARVTDIKSDPATQLVNSQPITVTLEVLPVNDKPFATQTDVITSKTIDEDQVIIFTAAELIDPFYSPGPANEASQLLVFQSVFSSNLGDSVSSLGGILEIQPDGRAVQYTPPADYNGSIPDVFNFIVADVPGGNLISQSADKPGTVSITINPVNDPPIAGNDFYNAMEDTNLSIAIRGGGGLVGILDNDRPGPQNEIDPPENQTIDLPLSQFPLNTQRGGQVRVENGQLVYSPPGLYSGPDSFTYRVVDNLGAESIGTVSISVGGQNDAPLFQGVNGEKDNQGIPVDEITLPESKPNAQSTQYDLNTWFTDPENDAITYSVTSSNPSVVSVSLTNNLLTLTRPAFAFGTVSLSVVATDTSNLSTTELVTVSIVNENDPPQVIGQLDPLSGDEDQVIVRQLSSIFSDPDGDTLTYTVSQLGSIVRPTPEQIANDPLIQSIDFFGDQMRITPKPNQFGVVDIEIEASDGTFRVSDAFTLTINPVEDTPIAIDDSYNVPIGSALRVLNPADGLLRNDSDADGDTISIDLASVTQPRLGSLQINADGTFIYTNNAGTVGEVDSFTYRIVDSTSRFSQTATVEFTLNQSQYQNPIGGFEADVTADGFISPIDALRVLNFLARRSPASGAVPVGEIGTPPPDFLDVDGNGMVSPKDALDVINTLALNQANGEGESISRDVLTATTTSFAAISSDFLPATNATPTPVESTEPAVMTTIDSTDALLTAGLQIDSVQTESAGELLIDSSKETVSEATIDGALTDMFDDMESLLEN